MKIANPRRFGLFAGIILMVLVVLAVALFLSLRDSSRIIDRPLVADSIVNATAKQVPMKITTFSNGQEKSALLVTKDGYASSADGVVNVIQRKNAVYQLDQSRKCFTVSLLASPIGNGRTNLDELINAKKEKPKEINVPALFDTKKLVASFLPKGDYGYTFVQNQDSYTFTWKNKKNQDSGTLTANKAKLILNASSKTRANVLDYKFEYAKAPELPQVPDNICK